ncbi:hypothetical protein PC116_g24485 [Phytophthora cactorum]|uniref:Uncharacterized protein n=1 Tax=Phytophthora cactorum TaxID=29920 RepID=A0A8T1JTT5_9STRA|nr:hypothetical protein Pcac1_g3963 [Phytophthora cactorum]KAG2899551.1 hypothetical protein PC117_g22196 [Phytophthora cactorum]KAG3169555.1 hypothetical protein C6341_g11038 [Phytophthora cactorum]KAG3188734.1 hypothetical protein PC128_g12086 [Phytophthora cactorum]KAG4056040.1 hypothetical protein PC123_g8870 [Phytophthora cactorum]
MCSPISSSIQQTKTTAGGPERDGNVVPAGQSHGQMTPPRDTECGRG